MSTNKNRKHTPKYVNKKYGLRPHFKLELENNYGQESKGVFTKTNLM